MLNKWGLLSTRFFQWFRNIASGRLFQTADLTGARPGAEQKRQPQTEGHPQLQKGPSSPPPGSGRTAPALQGRGQFNQESVSPGSRTQWPISKLPLSGGGSEYGAASRPGGLPSLGLPGPIPACRGALSSSPGIPAGCPEAPCGLKPGLSRSPPPTRPRRTSGSRWKMTTRPPLSPVASSSPVWLNSTVEMISAVVEQRQEDVAH